MVNTARQRLSLYVGNLIFENAEFLEEIDKLRMALQQANERGDAAEQRLREIEPGE